MRLPLVQIASFAMVLSLAACGGDESGAPSSSASTPLEEIDACALLTAAEIEAATGITPGAPENDSGMTAAPPMCDWPLVGGSVNILVSRSSNYTSFDEAVADWKESSEGMDFPFDPDDYEEVEGPGTVNVWIRQLEMFQAHRGNRMLQVYARVGPDRDPRQVSVELARHALARLD